MAADTFEFTMPTLGADMDAGKLMEWLVKPGDVVDKGDIVAVVDTAKAAIEVECFHAGVVKELIVEPGTTVAVGTPLAVLSATGEPAETRPREPAERPPAAPSPARSTRALPAPGPLVRKLAAELEVDLASVKGTGAHGQLTRSDVRRAAKSAERTVTADRISPYARQLAQQVGVDLATVRGTGRGGAIRADDVRAAAANRVEVGEPVTAAEPPAAQDRDAAARRIDTMRQATARLMTRSKREIPHYYVRTTIDVTDALTWLRERNRELPVADRILPAALFLRATALAAVKVPELNGYWEDDRFVPGVAVNVGVAVSLRGGGLITPVLADAAGLGLADLMGRLRDVAARAKSGRLRGSEMTGATITVTNLGDLGVEEVYGVIYPPQVAMVGVGKVVARPWAVDGLLGVRSVATVTLSADHRATDGLTGARFLDAISRAISQPDGL